MHNKVPQISFITLYYLIKFPPKQLCYFIHT